MSQKKGLERKRIPESKCTKKGVDKDIPKSSKDSNRKVTQLISTTSILPRKQAN